MQPKSHRLWMFMLVPLLSVAALARAIAVPPSSTYDSQTATPLTGTAAPIPIAIRTPAFALAGRWGVGFDSIPGASATDTSLIPELAQSNAAAVRYWVSDKLAWDGLMALDLNSFPDEASPTTSDLGSSYGFGTALKYNLKRPMDWLLIQLIGKATWASLEQSSTSGSTAGTNETTTTFGLGAGIGFEAFLPFWNSLSVEGSVLLDFISSQTKASGSSGPSAIQSGSTLSFDGNGFTPLNVAIHLYF